MLKTVAIIYLLLTSSLIAEPAEPLRFESGTKKNTLIELYTSEGCSSCPPAEEFLNNLRNKKELWKTWVPVAFHVNYWDYIGWKDRYATEEFGLRQSKYASLKHASTVYTPAFMVNGSGWRRGLFSRAIPVEKSSTGNLVVSIDGKSVQANYQPLKLNIAVLGMELTSQIERGENEGRTANHEFVVVGYDSITSNVSQENNLPWQCG